jgi:hypothetical protein
VKLVASLAAAVVLGISLSACPGDQGSSPSSTTPAPPTLPSPFPLSHHQWCVVHGADLPVGDTQCTPAEIAESLNFQHLINIDERCSLLGGHLDNSGRCIIENP